VKIRRDSGGKEAFLTCYRKEKKRAGVFHKPSVMTQALDQTDLGHRLSQSASRMSENHPRLSSPEEVRPDNPNDCIQRSETYPHQSWKLLLLRNENPMSLTFRKQSPEVSSSISSNLLLNSSS
jgi:hypothetical protein